MGGGASWRDLLPQPLRLSRTDRVASCLSGVAMVGLLYGLWSSALDGERNARGRLIREVGETRGLFLRCENERVTSFGDPLFLYALSSILQGGPLLRYAHTKKYARRMKGLPVRDRVPALLYPAPFITYMAHSLPTLGLEQEIKNTGGRLVQPLTNQLDS